MNLQHTKLYLLIWWQQTVITPRRMLKNADIVRHNRRVSSFRRRGQLKRESVASPVVPIANVRATVFARRT